MLLTLWPCDPNLTTGSFPYSSDLPTISCSYLLQVNPTSQTTSWLKWTGQVTGFPILPDSLQPPVSWTELWQDGWETHISARKGINQDLFQTQTLKTYQVKCLLCWGDLKKSLLLWQDLGLIRKWCCRIPGTHDAKSGVVREDMFIWWEGRWPTTLPLHRSLKLPVTKDFLRTSIYCAEFREQLKRLEPGRRKIFLTIMRGFKYLGVFLKQSWVASLSSSFYKFIRLCGGMLYQWFPSWVPENSRVSWNPRFLQCVL